MFEGMGKLTEAMNEEREKQEFESVRLGMRLAGVVNAYYGEKLIAYLKGEDEGGGMYFCELKPLYDEFGYNKVNKALLRLDEEKRTNE